MSYVDICHDLRPRKIWVREVASNLYCNYICRGCHFRHCRFSGSYIWTQMVMFWNTGNGNGVFFSFLLIKSESLTNEETLLPKSPPWSGNMHDRASVCCAIMSPLLFRTMMIEWSCFVVCFNRGDSMMENEYMWIWLIWGPFSINFDYFLPYIEMPP